MRFSTEDLFYLLIVPGLLYGILDLAFSLFLSQKPDANRQLPALLRFRRKS